MLQWKEATDDGNEKNLARKKINKKSVKSSFEFVTNFAVRKFSFCRLLESKIVHRARKKQK